MGTFTIVTITGIAFHTVAGEAAISVRALGPQATLVKSLALVNVWKKEKYKLGDVEESKVKPRINCFQVYP